MKYAVYITTLLVLQLMFDGPCATDQNDILFVLVHQILFFNIKNWPICLDAAHMLNDLSTSWKWPHSDRQHMQFNRYDTFYRTADMNYMQFVLWRVLTRFNCIQLYNSIDIEFWIIMSVFCITDEFPHLDRCHMGNI